MLHSAATARVKPSAPLLVERLTVVEKGSRVAFSEAFASPNQHVLSSGHGETPEESRRRLEQRLATAPPARSGLLFLGPGGDLGPRLSLLRLVAGCLATRDAEIAVHLHDSEQTQLGWQLLDAARHTPELRGVVLRLCFCE